MTFKVIIAGGRDFFDPKLFFKKVSKILSNIYEDIEIISGGAKGADALGELYAEWGVYECIKFPADWNKHGNAAGVIRNKEMAEYADALIAFWDGKSRGTADMIQRAKAHGLKIRVIHYENI